LGCPQVVSSGVRSQMERSVGNRHDESAPSSSLCGGVGIVLSMLCVRANLRGSNDGWGCASETPDGTPAPPRRSGMRLVHNQAFSRLHAPESPVEIWGVLCYTELPDLVPCVAPWSHLA